MQHCPAGSAQAIWTLTAPSEVSTGTTPILQIRNQIPTIMCLSKVLQPRWAQMARICIVSSTHRSHNCPKALRPQGPRPQ